LAVVQLLPAEGVVAITGSQVDLLASLGVVGEVGEDISFEWVQLCSLVADLDGAGVGYKSRCASREERCNHAHVRFLQQLA
jgi:hypothetical protein